MKVLIVNSNRYRQPWPVMPVGACMVASAVENAGHELRFLDLCFSEDPIADVRQALAEFGPECIGVSIRNIDNCVGYRPEFLLEDLKPLMEFLKGTASCPVVLGGAALFINGPEILEFFDMEYASIGDGERVFVDILDRLTQKQDLLGVDGLLVRRGGTLVQKDEYKFSCDVNSFPSYSVKRYLDLTKYGSFDVSLQIQTKRGCALRCSYCPNKHMEGLKYRLVDPQRIADQIETLVHETGIKRVEFVDSTFNIPSKHSKEVLKAIVAKKLGLQLNALGLNPRGIDEEFANLMVESGFQTATINIDAGCDETLRDMQKNFTTDQIRKCVSFVRNKRLTIAWYLLLGAEAESYGTLVETLNFIRKVASVWDAVFIAVGLRIYKGSPIADRMLERDPSATHDGFLRPMVVHPSKIDLHSLYTIVKHYSLGRPNFIIYNDEATPEFITKIGFRMVKRFFPRFPVWHLRIFGQVINQVTGLLMLQQFVFWLRNRGILRAAQSEWLAREPG